MQWTDESGAAYGQDPYADAANVYAYGHEDGGSAVADTESLTWDPFQQAQWAYPTEHTQVVGTDPYATGMPLYAAEPDPLTTAWDSPHGDVPILPFPESGSPGLPAPGSQTAASASALPDFVDSAGRRRRRMLRAARLLMILVGGYVALLISSALGGPTISSPFVPQPHSTYPATPRATAPDPSPGTDHSPGSASPTAARKNAHPTAARTASGPTDGSTAFATTAPAEAPTSPASPPAATPDPGPKGRAIGSSHKPVK
nr:hypothetical protein OG999_43910 [Streptomyces sp. NBC_00886]